MSYKLSATLHGHEKDVRSLSSDGNLLFSGLRDGSTRIWSDFSGGFPMQKEAFHLPTGGFINAVAFVDAPTGKLIASAGQDATIFLSDIEESSYKKGDDYGRFQLVGHQGNVCSVSYKDGLIASSSWDSTAKIWDANGKELLFDLKGHESSVWDVKIVDADNYVFLTSSADRTIRKWVKNKEVACFTGHSDVVRALVVFPDGKTFASTSNDGTVRIWDLESGRNIHTLTGHDSFVYDVAVLPNSDLVSTGEDRTVRVWHGQKVVQAITLPCVSVWTVAVLDNGDFAVGGSDSVIRVFTTEESRFASPEEQRNFADSVQQSSIAEQSLSDLKRTDIPDYSALNKPGKQEGSTIMVKNSQGAIEAHQWSGGEWIKIGDVVGSAGGSTEKKEFNGQLYDYVFDVDIEDGAPPLKLPFNKTENVYTVAEKFLADNDLPASYQQEVMDFITKNTGGIELDQQAGPVENPYSDAHQAAVSKKVNYVFPQRTYISFGEFKRDQLVKGLHKFNGLETNKIPENGLLEIEQSLADLTSKEALNIITLYVPQILLWLLENRLIGYDLLRVAVPRVTTVDLIRSTEVAEIVLKAIHSGLDEITSTAIPLFMMILRLLCNLVGGTLFLQLYSTTDDGGKLAFSEFFDELTGKLERLLEVVSQNKANKHYNTAATAFASFIYNLSAFSHENLALKSNKEASVPVMVFANNIGGILVAANAEAAYRLSIAYGNYKVLGLKEEAKWLGEALTVYSGEERFGELAKEI